MLHYTRQNDFDGIVALRYPRSSIPVPMRDEVDAVDWGTWEWLTPPSEIVMLATGALVHEAISAAEILSRHGISLDVVNASFIKPLDLGVLVKIREKSR